jgi:iron complex outermembrane receptor protein
VGEHLMLRANVARGYRAPNIPEIGSNGLDPGAHIVYLGNREFQPEFSLQEDIGVLWQSKNWEASAEVFHNYVADFIYQARLFDAQGQPVEVVSGNATYQYQQAAARLYGGELSLNLHPAALPWLSWRTGAALVIGLNDNPALHDQVGEAARYLPLMPPAQARTELRLTAPARPTSRLTASYLRLTLDGTARQNRFYAVDGAETATAGYILLGAGVGTTLRTKAGREAVQLFVQVDNVLDTVHQAHLNRLKYFEYYAASPTGRLGIFNPGRNVGVKVVMPF